MAKKERVSKHPDWLLSRSEKNWYYVGDTARLFCTSLVGTYMTMFLMFQGINTASLDLPGCYNPVLSNAQKRARQPEDRLVLRDLFVL